MVGVFKLVERHVSADSPKVTSGITGYCLNDRDGTTATNAVVDAWKCNGSMPQDWETNINTITHDGSYCLSVQSNDTNLFSKVVLNTCNGDPGQIWLRDQTGFQNPNSGLCLSASQAQPENQLFIGNCNQLSSPQETWIPSLPEGNNNKTSTTCTGTKGEKVACYAIKEWTTWQSGLPNHEALLNEYTDSAPEEQWCADFVSYVYKEAGYPFTQGDTNGWDENDANEIQYLGFTLHPASSGYIPRMGDVAYFDYAAGHVEIVVAGGKNPTFIYGDSATIDPTTGNGQMMANTITEKNGEGQLMYYLSPE
jgi:hypothetical protein